MNEQEARLIESRLSTLLPGCLAEAYGSTNANYATKQFEEDWKVAVYSASTKETGTLICVIRDKKHADAFLDVCNAYYHQRVGNSTVYPRGKSFVDQNDKTVIQGQVYTVEEYEQL